LIDEAGVKAVAGANHIQDIRIGQQNIRGFQQELHVRRPTIHGVIIRIERGGQARRFGLSEYINQLGP